MMWDLDMEFMNGRQEKPRVGRRRRSWYTLHGRTSNARPESLRDRVQEYCRNGSHKADLINDALTSGYELWFRVKSAPDRQTAEDLENELLDRYDYAWNVRRNGEFRRILH